MQNVPNTSKLKYWYVSKHRGQYFTNSFSQPINTAPYIKMGQGYYVDHNKIKGPYYVGTRQEAIAMAQVLGEFNK